mmetsp:Transcript_49593/g.146546  ORF Transcript_49593/g.146546 Transcript_49593/m.146546 type:complete len:233 (+) Transcript_49593:737-1435(+)
MDQHGASGGGPPSAMLTSSASSASTPAPEAAARLRFCPSALSLSSSSPSLTSATAASSTLSLSASSSMAAASSASSACHCASCCANSASATFCSRSLCRVLSLAFAVSTSSRSDSMPVIAALRTGRSSGRSFERLSRASMSSMRSSPKMRARLAACSTASSSTCRASTWFSGTWCFDSSVAVRRRSWISSASESSFCFTFLICRLAMICDCVRFSASWSDLPEAASTLSRSA